MDDVEDDSLRPSKSALKREMSARQALGEALCELSPGELATIPIEDAQLLDAIVESRRIHTRSALRRHRQFIGKLMRRVDTEPLQAALDSLHQQRAGDAARFHELEQLRDALVRDGDPALELALKTFPRGDRQMLRQLMRNARSEVDTGRNRGAGTRLFRYLRELQEEE